MYGQPKKVSLYYQDRTSDKEYHLSLERTVGGWKVTSQFGPRDGTLTHVDKTRGKAVDFYEAEAIFDKTEREKRNKGYKEKDTYKKLIDKMKKTSGIVWLSEQSWNGIAQAATEYFEEQA